MSRTRRQKPHVCRNHAEGFIVAVNDHLERVMIADVCSLHREDVLVMLAMAGFDIEGSYLPEARESFIAEMTALNVDLHVLAASTA